MALIGFRSPLTYHPWPWSEYTEEQKKMFNVRPGITGWAQVNGRKTVEWNKRIELNGWYAEHVWDIAIRENDCVLIEANPNGMANVIQIAGAKGRKKQYEELRRKIEKIRRN